MFDGLVELDPGLNIVPSLADTWTVSRDGRVYRFHLREGVRFHDGRPLLADDVVFSFRRLLDQGRRKRSIGASYLMIVDGAPAYRAGRSRELPGIVAIDASRVEIRLTRPYPSFLDVLAMDDLRIVPRQTVLGLGEEAFGHRPVGTGPFRLAAWTDSELRRTANPDYFQGAPYLDQVVILFPRPDEKDAGNARFMRGETEIVEPTSDTLQRLATDPRIEIRRFNNLSVTFLGMNTGVPPLDDVRVRRAIARAIDGKALAAVDPESRREAQGILPPGLPSYSPTAKVLPYDRDAARRLLAGAGHPGGRGLPPLRFYLARSGSKATARGLDLLHADLAAVGIALEVHEVTWRELDERIEHHSAPLFQIGWVADLPDPDAFLRTLFEPGGAANYFDFLDDETARTLERGALEINPVERARIYRTLEKNVLDKAPLVPLFHSAGVFATRREVRGLKPSPMGIGSLALKRVWLDADRSTQ
jgi:ABC-type transport system substrate-binding protein